MEQGTMADFCNFWVLPEDCISNIISLTSPKEACSSSLVSLIFKSAADSDLVWENFLPSDYKEIISTSLSPSSLIFPSKKELYFHLSDHFILIDSGSKSFALEKLSGKKCFMIGARGLSITWADTSNYWRWISLPDSRFKEVAELLMVCWLEIHGKIETRILSPKTTYVCYLVVKFMEGAYGFEFQPVEVSVGFVGGEAESQYGYLNPCNRQIRPFRRRRRSLWWLTGSLGSPPEPRFLQERKDGWMEIEMGEFFNDTGKDGEVEMKLLEVNNGNWKGGLIIQGIEIRPKESKLDTNV